jgi:Domain of unknown function (DUF1905)
VAGEPRFYLRKRVAMGSEMKRHRNHFQAELIKGHKGVTPVIVPFDPQHVWGIPPIEIDLRRDGWLVRGTMNGAPFEGWIGRRWGRFFIILDPVLRAAAKASVGQIVDVTIEPTSSKRALAIAREQAKLTTAPRNSSRRRS